MPSERVQRQVDRLLDEAEEAIRQLNWAVVRDRVQAVLRLDPENADALDYLAAVEREAGATASLQSAPAAPSGAPTPTPEPSPSLPTSPSTELRTSFASGRYQVRRFLGEGGKKRVYLAHDSRLDRDVAFALIKAEGLDTEGLARITREAQAMGRLGDHPHIVTVYDIGEETFPEPFGSAQDKALEGNVLSTGSRNVPYIVSQFMPGGDVMGLIEQAPDHKLPLDQALRIADQVCQALDHAHAHGIVHRDLKPGNVWLASPLPLGEGRGEGIIAKLGDFGLAMALDRSRLTREGMMVGTVSYMPPEQALGGQVDARSDLYSLGAMLYEMACGRPPFVGDDSIAIIGQHLNTPPVAPSWHRPDCPQALEAIILRLLEKDPTKRPASAAEVRQALSSIDLTSARPEPVEGKPAPTENPLYRRTFVGREQELKQLQAAFDGALSGQGALLMVVGEPGIGKTALCEQLATYVALRGGRALVGHCYEEGSLSLPYLAFVEAMRTYVLAREPEALRSELGTGAADVARIVSEIRDRVQVELRPPGDPEDDRWRLLQAVTGFLRNAATVQPLAIVLEDLHWADRGTLDLLIHVARNLAVADSTGRGARLLIIGTYRDVEVDRAHPLSGALAELRRIASFGRVTLRGLTVDEVHRMMSSIRGQKATWSRAEAIHRQTEGNPLFIQEVLRYLVEAGLVVREGGRYVRTDDGSPEAGIPEGLRDVIGKRLSRLGPECNRLLAIAAVIGRDFALETLQAVANLPEEEVLAGLEEAVHVGVLEDQSRGGAVRFRFAHAFFRQTLYEEIFTPRRIRLHQQVARALEAQYAARLEEHAAELAEHFAQSSDPADLTKAIQYGELAARRALGVYAYGEAVRLLEQALQGQEVLDPDDEQKRCDLLLALGEALLPAGEPLRAYEQVAEEVFSLAEALDDRGRASRACQMALLALLSYGSAAAWGMPAYRGWVERADRYAAPGTRERVFADLARGNILFRAGQWGEHRALSLRALDLARQLDDPQALFDATYPIIVRGFGPQHREERFRLAQEFVTKSRQGVSARTLGLVLHYAGTLFLARGDRNRAEELWREATEWGERTREPELLLFPMVREAWLATMDGHLEAALAAGERLIARASELGSPVWGWLQSNLATSRALLLLGRADEALAALPRAAELAEAEPGAMQATRSAVLLAHLGRSGEAQALLAESMARWQITEEETETPTQWLTLLLETAVLVGDRDAASILAHHLRGSAPSVIVAQGILTSFARLLGAAAALLGEREQARAYYQQALEACAKVGFRPETALTRLQLAELLLDEAVEREKAPPHPSPLPPGERGAPSSPSMGEDTGGGDIARAKELRREALEHLDFAIGEFQEMKMQPSLERALRHKGLLGA